MSEYCCVLNILKIVKTAGIGLWSEFSVSDSFSHINFSIIVMHLSVDHSVQTVSVVEFVVLLLISTILAHAIVV